MPIFKGDVEVRNLVCEAMPIVLGHGSLSSIIIVSIQAHGELMASPYFFMDIMYSHEPPSTSNSCQVCGLNINFL